MRASARQPEQELGMPAAVVVADDVPAARRRVAGRDHDRRLPGRGRDREHDGEQCECWLAH